MAYCCSQCSFTAQFESALMMHHQLHHEASAEYPVLDTPKLQEKSHTLPRTSPPASPFFRSKNKDIKRNLALPARTSSATRLFDRLKARISKSRTLFSHPEEATSSKNLSVLPSDCTSVTIKNVKQRCPGLEDPKEVYPCHLCAFDADRITVLDRHLLNDHKIGLENLLKLVMAKTKNGLAEDNTATTLGIRQPYYRPENEIIQDGEFIIETVTPTIKILKHAATNTDPFTANFPKEIEEFLTNGDAHNDGNFMGKMQALNDYMCKFVCSSNALKKALNKELDSKVNVKEHDGIYMGLGDNSPRDFERAHSDKTERYRNKSYADPESSRGEKSKSPSDSFYF